MRHTRTLVIALVVVATLLISCSSGNSATPDTLPSPASTEPTASTAAAAATDAVSTTTTAVAADLPDLGIDLSPDGPWERVASVPGVDLPGLGYRLMDGVWAWLPTVEDLPSGITWVLNENDRPIIEAYLLAQYTVYRSITSQPMDFTGEGWLRYYTDEGRTRKVGFWQAHADLGRRVELADGVVLRPVVMGERRTDTEALIYDCMLDGAVTLETDGQLSPDSGWGVSAEGGQALMHLDGGTWRAGRMADRIEGVCV